MLWICKYGERDDVILLDVICVQGKQGTSQETSALTFRAKILTDGLKIPTSHGPVDKTNEIGPAPGRIRCVFSRGEIDNWLLRARNPCRIGLQPPEWLRSIWLGVGFLVVLFQYKTNPNPRKIV